MFFHKLSYLSLLCANCLLSTAACVATAGQFLARELSDLRTIHCPRRRISRFGEFPPQHSSPSLAQSGVFQVSLISSARLSSFPLTPKNDAICLSCSRPVLSDGVEQNRSIPLEQTPSALGKREF